MAAEKDSRLKGAERGIQELRKWNHDLSAQIEALLRQVSDIEKRVAPIEPFVAASRVAPDPASIGLERFDAGQAGQVIGYRNLVAGVEPRDDYVAFEDVFRLSEKVIRERQRPYVRLLEGRQPILDAGCGRGEFLQLLHEAGLQARGVDLDAGMVERARAKGLDVRQGDVVEYLQGLPDGSLGAVFAAQVVEHLPYPRLITLLRLSARKLAPGGILIAETVNPHAPGALKNFWFDLTHQHPVFPEVLLTLCRGIGFTSAYIFHPSGSSNVESDRENSPDYALVAERGTTSDRTMPRCV